MTPSYRLSFPLKVLHIDVKNHMTELAFEKLNVIKQEMAKDYLKSDENEPS